MELGECLEEGEDLEASETVRLRTAQQPHFSFSSIDDEVDTYGVFCCRAFMEGGYGGEREREEESRNSSNGKSRLVSSVL